MLRQITILAFPAHARLESDAVNCQRIQDFQWLAKDLVPQCATTLLIEKIGNNSASATPPMSRPINMIIAGSM